MSCISPTEMKIDTRYKGKQTIKIDCRHCMNCMIKRQQNIEFLAKKELLYTYKKGKSAAFVTLTYDDNHLPVNKEGFYTLNRKDIQLWLKNMRRQMDYYNEKIPFKVMYCGEYGDGTHSTTNTGVSTHRPHYHLVIFGLNTSQVKKYTRKLWKHGLCDIGELSFGGIRYLCKYMTKATPDKDVKFLRETVNVQNPFFYHSIGLGKEWINENINKIVEDGFTYNINGKINLFPAYIMRYVSYKTGINYIPYVKDYLYKNAIGEAKAKNISFSQYDYEKSYLKEILMVNTLRSKGKPVNDITLSKNWAKPFHSFDRVPTAVSDIVSTILK